MRIPAADLAAQHHELRDELLAACSRVLASGAFILGAEVERFEREFAEYCEVEHTVGVANGTDALVLALRALHVAPNDYVIVPAFTFIATAEAVCLAGARPLFVDVDPDTFNLDPAALAQALQNHGNSVRALIAVHLYGQPADMDEINALARRHDVAVIEDAAQAHGARYRGKRTGGLGRMACFSFYPTKNLGAAGDGGAVTTDDEGLAARLRLLRDHGQISKYMHSVVGYNSRLDALQAAILSVKLKHLDAWNTRRQQIAQRYRDALPDSLAIPRTAADREHVYHLYVVRSSRRDQLAQRLAERGIASSVHYPLALPQQRVFAQLEHPCGDFPNARAAAREVLALPCYPELSDSAVDEICTTVQQWASSH